MRGVYFVLRRPRRNLFCLQTVPTRCNQAADLGLFDQSRRCCCQPANAAKLSKHELLATGIFSIADGRLIIPAGTEVHGKAQKRWQRASFLPATVWTRQRPAARHGWPKSLHKFAQIPGRVWFAQSLHSRFYCTRFARAFLPATSRKCTDYT